METILDDVNVCSNTNTIRTASWSVNLPASTTEIKGQSDALNKFQACYEALDNAVSAYSNALRMDLQAIDLLVDTRTENDRKQSELFKNGNGVFDAYLTR